MERKQYTMEEIQQILTNLDNGISEPQERRSRVKLPIPKEYGGGWATGDTMEDAIRNLVSRIGIQTKKETPMFTDVMNTWLEMKKGQKKAPSTIANYTAIAEVKLKPFFGDKHIDEITPDDIQLYYNSIMDKSKSASTQSKAVLRGIFESAERKGWITTNPMRFSYVRSKKSSEKVVLQEKDLLKVIQETEKLKTNPDKRDYIYFCFLCFTALRRGEILGLRWGDLDFEEMEIHVRNNVTFPNGVNDCCLGEPKDGSDGIVYLNSQLAKRIREYRGDVDDYILPYGEDDEGRKLPMTRSMFTKMWRRCTKVVNVNGATSHSFRASYVSMMNAHCKHVDPKVLQGALRHKTPDLALKVYAKENENKTRVAEKEYDAYLCKSLGTKRSTPRKKPRAVEQQAIASGE